MDTEQTIKRIEDIEHELKMTREARHERNSRMVELFEELREGQLNSEERIQLLEGISNKLTQLLEGAMHHKGVVEMVNDNRNRIDSIEKKLYMILGGLGVIQFIGFSALIAMFWQ